MIPPVSPRTEIKRQRLTTWDLMVKSAEGNPKEMKEIRDVLKKIIQQQSCIIN